MERAPSPTGEENDRGLLASLPKSPSQFDDDTRISYSKLDSKYILETDEGGEYEYDDKLKRWIPVLDESLIDQQNEIYKVEGVDESEIVPSQRKKKRKNYTHAEEEEKPEQKAKKPRVNTAVYVTSIPLDADAEEIHQIFSRCGVVAEEIDSGNHRIKMYEDDKGQFKGEALVVYFRPESVNLAIQLLDDTDFRLGVQGPHGRMRVQAADFSYKKQQEAPAEQGKKVAQNRDRSKIIKKTQKLNSKLADWDDDDPSVLPETSSRWDKVVVLKHMFTLEELEEDPASLLEIKEDIRDECSKLGDVTNIVIYDKEPDGIATVRFSNGESAKACVRVMQGRFFSSQAIEAYISPGGERFKKTNEKKPEIGLFDDDKNDAAVNDDEQVQLQQGNGNGATNGKEEEKRRLDEFGNWLEGQK